MKGGHGQNTQRPRRATTRGGVRSVLSALGPKALLNPLAVLGPSRFLGLALLCLAAPAFSPAQAQGSGAITPARLEDLEQVWEMRTGHDEWVQDHNLQTNFSATPVLAGSHLVVCTPFNEIQALDPATGALRWRYDPQVPLVQAPRDPFDCRGVTAWRDPQTDKSAACATRIFSGTRHGLLLAIDAQTGDACADFGAQGRVRLDTARFLAGSGGAAADRDAGLARVTSPPTVIGDTVIVTATVRDWRRAPAGIILAFDARTGAFKWQFTPVDAAPDRGTAGKDFSTPPGQPPASVAADPALGLVFVATGSPRPVHDGAPDQPHANALVALKAATGAVAWHHQLVRADQWDYGLTARPGLYDLPGPSGPRPVVTQTTKAGHVFVFDRTTGDPVFPLTDYRAPGTDRALPDQPVPASPPSLVAAHLTAETAWGMNFLERRGCHAKISALDAQGLYTPPSAHGSVLFPYAGGAAHWGGTAFDPARGWLVVNTTNLAQSVAIVPVEEARRHAGEKDSQILPLSDPRQAALRQVLVSPMGLPCNPPPWGQLHAVDLTRGEIVWSSTLGTTRDIAPFGVSLDWGTPNAGGPLVTDTGLIFIAATMDYYLRAFDIVTGQELWKGRLPAGAQSTPALYTWQGRDYVVVAAGGSADLGTKGGDWVVAFALNN